MSIQLLISLLLLLTFHLTKSSSEYPIKLSVSQHRTYFPYEPSTFTQYVNVEIKTDDNKDQRPNISQELFLILDTSGSMESEEKLTNAKLAIGGIIENLGRNDKLHLIQYNSYSSVVFTDQNDRELMLNRLKSLKALGGTNLVAGFDETRLLLKKYSTRRSLKRIFVFSDGQINHGVTDHQQILNEVTSMKTTYELAVCSFGIGTDFDEKLMTNLADYGSGDYFFIEGAQSMKKVIDIAFKSFRSLMGTGAYLRIRTKNDARLRNSYQYQKGKDDQSHIFPINDIQYNDHLDVLLEAEVKITETSLEQNEIEYMIIELWMVDIEDQQSKLVSTESISFSLSKNTEELKSSNPLVDHLIQLQNIQKRDEEVIRLLNQKERQKASKIKREITDRLKVISLTVSKYIPKNKPKHISTRK